MTTRRINRREALAASAAALGYFHFAPAVSAARVFRANEKLRVAGIGVGGKGSSDIDDAANLMDVVALCDVDEGHLAPKVKKWASAKTFTDFRKLFDDTALLKNIDAVTVSTPDHNHAVISILAMRAGKHVYCQKPLTHDVYEAHLMRAEAKKNKVCTQMGNQGTAANGLRRAAELLQKGELGDVTEVHVWTNRPAKYWKQAPDISPEKPPKKGSVPKNVHWDEFLGVAPDFEYAGGIHPFAWRGYWAYGTGAIGDMACHTANMAFMGLKLAHPVKVSAEAADVNPLTCPSSAHVTIEFPKRGDLPPVTVHWYEGTKGGKKVLPPEALVQKATELSKGKLVDSGSILVGSKGFAYSPDDYGANVFFSTGTRTGSNTKPETMPENNKHDQGQKNEWVEAIKAGKPELALSNFGHAGLLTAAFLLGNVAIRTGKSFNFDGEKCQADIKEAAPLIRRTYRKGWDLIGYNA
ncbi:Inositol 2-dehydrogenase [Gemmata sp. SH-PL17]|uniref:Gfo/Idh/MocA family protein n=1 Tax=Gemmata sp. SH-PL17 TaxID=1630693 RepID=UPI0004BCC79D|nr:Gfo/Idh/MocA family oxidoreductase [Gemmata sp. SH-PL17]AMV27916.1 Inositol 2-dehydrogenase [Gemmata sp. SH-PL17]